MGAESSIERLVCERVAQGYGVQNTKFGYDGWPDRIFWLPDGRPFFIEFKAPGEKPDPRQAHRIDWLRILGYDVEVHDSYETAYRAIEDRVRAFARRGDKAGTNSVEASQLPEESDEVLDRARGKRVVPRSRSR